MRKFSLLLIALLFSFNLYSQEESGTAEKTVPEEIADSIRPGDENTEEKLGAPPVIKAEEKTAENSKAAPLKKEEPKGFMNQLDDSLGSAVGFLATIFFWQPFGGLGFPMPLVVMLLIFGAVYYTVRMGFINIFGFRHAIDVVRGKYDNPKDQGEITHFQALSSALSATVGLGNIAGVAVAVQLGGPGAVFWMVVAALFGMTSKFVECTLGVKYRIRHSDGSVSGGAMHYLETGLKEVGLGALGAPLGKFLAILFAILCIGGSFGGGNMFQANQSGKIVLTTLGIPHLDWLYGLILAALVGVVIIGGIKRIATTAEKIVPFMCGFYVLCGFVVLIANFTAIPAAIGEIVSSAFNPAAGLGGFIGVLITGIKRAAFSNEAGIGSAAIAHAAAKTDEPVREGIVSLLEPFIDTIIVCSMTGIVIVVSGVLDGASKDGLDGVMLTANAFSTVISFFPKFLSLAVFLFAFSTMISWSYYGERCWTYLFGSDAAWVSLSYKLIFLVFVFIGSVTKLGNVIDFSDLMILGMSFPNIIGGLLLSGIVAKDLREYMDKLKNGQFKVYK